MQNEKLQFLTKACEPIPSLQYTTILLVMDPTTTTQPLQLTYRQIYSNEIPEKIREAQKCVDVVQIVQEAKGKTGKGLKTQ